MKKLLATTLLFVTMTTPVMAAPNDCSVIPSGPYSGEYTCWFYPSARDGTLYAFPDSIRTGRDAIVSFSFAYNNGYKIPSWIDCNSTRNHWHIGGQGSRREYVRSDASRRMLNYVCEEAGFD